jgi:hemoglobin/transferrin/lactoferrin receptor protein
VTDFTLGGLFIGDEITLGGDRVTLHTALRFDHYSLDATDDPLLPAFAGADQSDSRITPRLGAVVRIGGGFSVYGNYAMGFKAPSPTQVNQFFANPAQAYTSIPNPDLRPETSETWEGGIRYQSGIASASLTAFTGSYDDFIEQVQIGGQFGNPANPAVFQFVNLDRARIHGIEGRAGVNFPSGFNADLAFAYASGDEIQPNGVRTPLVSVDPLKVVLGAGWRDPRGRFGAQLYLTAVGRKSLGAAAGASCAPNCYRPDASTVLDATAFWRISENFTLRAGLFNITDETYAYWGDVAGLAATSAVTDAYTQPGRNGRVSLSIRF